VQAVRLAKLTQLPADKASASETIKPPILFVSPEFPWPPLSGGRLRTLSLLRCLGARFRVHCVTFAEQQPRQEDQTSLRSYVAELTILRLQIHRRTTLHRYVRNIRRALRFVPPLVDRFAEPEHRQAMVELLKKAEWVWLEHLWLAPYATLCPAATKILDVHNVESAFYRQMRKTSRRPLDRLGYYVFERAAQTIERRFLPCFDRVLAVSEEDRRVLSQYCSAEKILVIPNAVKLNPISASANTEPHSLYFAGRLDYPPNRDAILWFYRQVWPLLRSRVPDLRCYVVGGGPERVAKELRGDGHFQLLGEVEKADAYLGPSSVAIVPVRTGGGTRFKILEAWAAGKAVVSTTKGAEGLAARHGENIWIADTAPEFADAIVRLLSDAALRASLGKRGWKTVEERYSLERLQESLTAALPDHRALHPEAAEAEPGCV
jgi:glycosyltransferase involved in cell wall biosynthesis